MVCVCVCALVLLLEMSHDWFLLHWQEGETAIEFAQRVKADICRKGGLVDLPW